jgi:hypothetical protein
MQPVFGNCGCRSSITKSARLNRRLREQFAALPGHSFVATVLAHHWAA